MVHMTTVQGFAACLVLAVIIDAGLLFFGVINLTPDQSVIEENSKLKLELAESNKQNDMLQAKNTALEEEVGAIKATQSYRVVEAEMEGNKQLGAIAAWLSTSSQSTLDTIQWIMSNGQSAINIINDARQANQAADNIKQTAGGAFSGFTEKISSIVSQAN